MRAQNEF
jgi:hypothetical protein